MQAEEKYNFEPFEEKSKFRGLLHKDGTEAQKFEENPQDAKQETMDDIIDRLKNDLSTLRIVIENEESASSEPLKKGTHNSLQDVSILEESLQTLLESSVQWKTLQEENMAGERSRDDPQRTVRDL